MERGNNSDKGKKVVIFSLLLLATAAISFMLGAILWQKKEVSVAATPVNKNAGAAGVKYDMLVKDNDVLASRVNTLQQLDQQYAGLLTDSNSQEQLNSINKDIYIQEEVFRGSIDSIFLDAPGLADSSLNKLFNDIISGYRSILENRRSISSLRTAINMNKTGLKPDEMAMLKNQNELQEKTNKIATLESELKAMTVKGPAIAPSKTDNTSDDVTALKENITELTNKVTSLTTANNALKQDNEKIVKQQNDAIKNLNAGELSFKNKTAGMQQRVDALNAELRLAQVDCNLNRVDASQIISTSKQRKQLLSEASGILTSLSNTDDPAIKKKVQDKILRLNQVAANSRD